MHKEAKHSSVILMTACINPGNTFSVARRDPETRLEDYKKSLKFLLSVPTIPRIVFCENSDSDLSAIHEVVRLYNPFQKNVELLSFSGQPHRPEYGKGYGEMRIIDYALAHSENIKRSKIIIKVTGRLIIANIERIAAAIDTAKDIDIFCDLRKNLSTTDSRIFCATPGFLTKYFLPHLAIMNESTGICFEDILARATHGAMADGLRWSMLPYAHDLLGVAGTSDTVLSASRWRLMKRELFRKVKSAILLR